MAAGAAALLAQYAGGPGGGGAGGASLKALTQRQIASAKAAHTQQSAEEMSRISLMLAGRMACDTAKLAHSLLPLPDKPYLQCLRQLPKPGAYLPEPRLPSASAGGAKKGGRKASAKA